MRYAVVLLIAIAGCTAAPIRGVVLDGHTGEPIRGAEITIVQRTTEKSEDDTRRVFRFKKLDVTGRKGTFSTTFPDIETRGYGLFVAAFNYNPAYYEVYPDGRIRLQFGNFKSCESFGEYTTVTLKASAGSVPDYAHMIPIIERLKEKGAIDETTWFMLPDKLMKEVFLSIEERNRERILEEKLRKAEELIKGSNIKRAEEPDSPAEAAHD